MSFFRGLLLRYFLFFSHDSVPPLTSYGSFLSLFLVSLTGSTILCRLWLFLLLVTHRILKRSNCVSFLEVTLFTTSSYLYLISLLHSVVQKFSLPLSPRSYLPLYKTKKRTKPPNPLSVSSPFLIYTSFSIRKIKIFQEDGNYNLVSTLLTSRNSAYGLLVLFLTRINHPFIHDSKPPSLGTLLKTGSLPKS